MGTWKDFMAGLFCGIALLVAWIVLRIIAG